MIPWFCGHVYHRFTDNAQTDYRSAYNWRLTISQLAINTNSYKNLTVLLLRQKKLLIVIPALRITVKPVLGDHPFTKVNVVTQNRRPLNEWSLTGTGIVVTIVTS